MRNHQNFQFVFFFSCRRIHLFRVMEANGKPKNGPPCMHDTLHKHRQDTCKRIHSKPIFHSLGRVETNRCTSCDTHVNCNLNRNKPFRNPCIAIFFGNRCRGKQKSKFDNRCLHNSYIGKKKKNTGCDQGSRSYICSNIAQPDIPGHCSENTMNEAYFYYTYYSYYSYSACRNKKIAKQVQ